MGQEEGEGTVCRVSSLFTKAMSPGPRADTEQWPLVQCSEEQKVPPQELQLCHFPCFNFSF